MIASSVTLSPRHDYSHLASEYVRDGFVVVGEVLTSDELADVRNNIKRYCDHVVPQLPKRVLAKTVRYESDGTSLRSCYFMDQVDEYFGALGVQSRFMSLIEQVSGYRPELYVVETFNKYARVGSEANAHQDAHFLPLDPPDIAHLWIAIDDATVENGALRYWRGTHHGGLKPHIPAAFGSRLDPQYVDYESDDIATVTLPAGSAVVHSGLVVHDSPPNCTSTPRLGLLCGYRGAHTVYIRDED